MADKKRANGWWVVCAYREEWIDEHEVARFRREAAAIDDMIAREKAYEGCGLTFSVHFEEAHDDSRAV